MTLGRVAGRLNIERPRLLATLFSGVGACEQNKAAPTGEYSRAPEGKV